MDKSTIIGLVAGIVFMLLAIVLSGGAMGLFLDPASVIIVLGGAFASLLICYPLKRFLASAKTIKLAFGEKTLDATEIINQVNELALAARKEGLLVLEERAQEMEDPFMKKGLLLIVDGTDPELVRSILETELIFLETRHKEHRGFWETLAELGPAWGMIGTLIGLIAMLDSLNDPSVLGPKMAVALITTLYGTILANFFATPVANKLKVRSQEEVALKQLMIEGLLSIQGGENPRVIEEKLKAFLAPNMRTTVDEKQTDMN